MKFSKVNKSPNHQAVAFLLSPEQKTAKGKSMPGVSVIQNKSGVFQLASKVTNSTQAYVWGDNNEKATIVGKTMEAFLDPADILQGEAASINTNQDSMMTWIKSHYKIGDTHAVKGHLLNDNLGGKAQNANLYPITKGANAVHLRTAENYAKNTLWIQKSGIYYKVDASRSGETSKFTYAIQDWDVNQDKKGSVLHSGEIVSDFGQAKSLEKANIKRLKYIKAKLKNAEAVRRGVAYDPHSRVGGLGKYWGALRDKTGKISRLEYGTQDSKTKYSEDPALISSRSKKIKKLPLKKLRLKKRRTLKPYTMRNALMIRVLRNLKKRYQQGLKKEDE